MQFDLIHFKYNLKYQPNQIDHLWFDLIQFKYNTKPKPNEIDLLRLGLF